MLDSERMTTASLLRRAAALLCIFVFQSHVAGQVYSPGTGNRVAIPRQQQQQSFGSTLVDGPKPLRFSDPVDIRQDDNGKFAPTLPGPFLEVGGAGRQGRDGTAVGGDGGNNNGGKPYRYLEPDVNQGRPSDEPFAPPITTTTPAPFSSERTNNEYNDPRETLKASATSASRNNAGSKTYYDTVDAEKKRRETLRGSGGGFRDDVGSSETRYGAQSSRPSSNEKLNSHSYGSGGKDGRSSPSSSSLTSRDRERGWSDGGSRQPYADQPNAGSKDAELIESIASELQYLNSKIAALRDRQRFRSVNGDSERTRDSDRDYYSGRNRDLDRQRYLEDLEREREELERERERYRERGRQWEQERERERERDRGRDRDLDRERERERENDAYRKEALGRIRDRQRDRYLRYSRNRYPESGRDTDERRPPRGRSVFGSGHGFPRELFDSRTYRNLRNAYFPPTSGRLNDVGTPAASAPDDQISNSQEEFDDLSPDRRAWKARGSSSQRSQRW